MYDRRQFEAWTRTARILQVITNANRNTDEYPDELPLSLFHPLMPGRTERPVDGEISFEDLKTIVGQ